MTTLIDLSESRESPSGDLADLQVRLTELIGEPFRFARVSYGDELTLHFGDLRAAHSPKLKDLKYGAYVLGVRASFWVLKAGAKPLLLASATFDDVPSGLGKPIAKEDVERNSLIEAESRVIAATPFVVRSVNGLGLQLRTSDGGSLFIIPALTKDEEADDEKLPELSDWELATPTGLLSAGPGIDWSFKPSH